MEVDLTRIIKQFILRPLILFTCKLSKFNHVPHPNKHKKIHHIETRE